jgi:hypothetical protein
LLLLRRRGGHKGDDPGQDGDQANSFPHGSCLQSVI